MTYRRACVDDLEPGRTVTGPRRITLPPVQVRADGTEAAHGLGSTAGVSAGVVHNITVQTWEWVSARHRGAILTVYDVLWSPPGANKETSTMAGPKVGRRLSRETTTCSRTRRRNPTSAQADRVLDQWPGPG